MVAPGANFRVAGASADRAGGIMEPLLDLSVPCGCVRASPRSRTRSSTRSRRTGSGANGCAGVVNSGCEVHDEGQLWAATLWEMYLNLADPDVALRVVTDGLKLTACNPSFLDARDAILLADRYAYAGAHQCIIWQTFADRYMGFSASVTSTDDVNPAGAQDVPSYCQSNGKVILNLDRYSCNDQLIATVHDNNAAGTVQVRLTIIVPETRHYVVVEDPIPAGTDAVNSTVTVRTAAGTCPSALPARASCCRLPTPVISHTTS